jgi:hypothetical protein
MIAWDSRHSQKGNWYQGGRQIGFEVRLEKLKIDCLGSRHPSHRNESQNAIYTSPPIDMLGIAWILRLNRYDIPSESIPSTASSDESSPADVQP